MQFEHSLKIAVPMRTAYETMRDSLDKLAVYLPNIVSITLIERSERSGKTYITSRWQGKHILPDIIGQVIKVADMAWLDRAEWRNDQYVCNWVYEPFVFKEYIDMHGTDTYSADGEQTTVTMRGEVTANFLNYPLLPEVLRGKLNEEISKILCSRIEPNFVTLYTGLEKYISGNR